VVGLGREMSIATMSIINSSPISKMACN
jgi:hypothetical protein